MSSYGLHGVAVPLLPPGCTGRSSGVQPVFVIPPPALPGPSCASTGSPVFLGKSGHPFPPQGRQGWAAPSELLAKHGPQAASPFCSFIASPNSPSWQSPWLFLFVLMDPRHCHCSREHARIQTMLPLKEIKLAQGV